ncbi:MAG TPA: HAMP domain-containing protein [Syntrophales bacterium]|nr:HAMP domain-containing protein [Syntrophales bacterium]HOM06207.1 HAMP domain-containing protein [Syntrophales bacterium]HOO00724.1 HAMP domain-containing protein [Syntrophales bacterium]HPQ05811.1 HAMP domain-containing protein [Syntrophales bacterium]
MKWTIGRKMLASYLAMALLTMLASSYAIFRLNNLNSLAHRIINDDFTALETARKAGDTLLAMEGAEKRYLILKDEAIAQLFRSRSAELEGQLEQLSTASPALASLLRPVRDAKRRYDGLFAMEQEMIAQGRPEEAARASSEEGRKILEAMTSGVRAVQRKMERTIDARLGEINAETLRAARVTMALTAAALAVGVLLAVLITLDISVPLRRLEKATGLVAEGRFDETVTLERGDEIGSLGQSFNVMMKRLKELEALRLDASPLTGLPGNRAIEEEIDKRLASGRVFALCHVDLDNFKAFADNYGYAWGSEVIKEVAKIMTEAAAELGGEDMFIGHIGGDDFIIIGDPERGRAVGERLVREFDRRIPAFLNEEDRRRGCIVSRDRQGNERSFPLLSVTVSVVTGDGLTYANPLEMAKMAAEVKNYGKTLAGSNVVTKEEMDGAS